MRGLSAVCPYKENEPMRHSVFVEYGGVVTGATGPAPYSIGQTVNGVLKIDTSFAGPDLILNDGVAQYHGNGDFITTLTGPTLTGGGAGDVHVADGIHYQITQYGHRDGDDWTTIELRADHLAKDSVRGEGIVQDFSATRGDGPRLWARLNGARRAVTYAVDFVFNRFSVTPGHCRAT
jgi:hypothetical protein